MKKILKIVTLVFLWCSTASAESTLPPCQDDIMRWTNCFGKMTYENGWSYVGEWKKGNWHGQGTVMYADGQAEKGRFRNGYLDNQKPETISLTGTVGKIVDHETIKKMKKKLSKAKKKQEEEEKILKDKTKLKKSFYRDEIYVPMSAYRNELKLYAPLSRTGGTIDYTLIEDYNKFKSEFESEVFKFCAYQNQNNVQFHRLNNMRFLYMMNSDIESGCIYQEARKLSEKYKFDQPQLIFLGYSYHILEFGRGQ